jgi:hypothetical protein
VKFEDGSTAEISRRAFDRTLASAVVGDVIPVRYDPADRTKIELDRHAVVERQDAEARERDAAAIARGEATLGMPSSAAGPGSGDLRIADADRELIAEALSQHMTDGRLTTDELEDRLGALYAAQTRTQARSVLAGLPPLAAAALPDWVNAPEAPALRASGASAPVPTDGELNTAYRRWQAKADKLKADKAAYEQARTSGDPREKAQAFKLKVSRGDEKSARAKFEQLRKRRPDWTAGER